jgi:UDP-4-amino-4,6-dideoxy-N-acetyl-beta-L-altrosamine N-acetyltransferase
MSWYKIVLRRVRPDDCDVLLEWRNSPSVAIFMYNDRQISSGEHKAWFKAMLEDDSSIYWIVEISDRPCGIISVNNINPDDCSASWAVYLADEADRGKGCGLYLEYCILSYSFDQRKFRRLRCEVLETNCPMQKLQETVGFELVGRLHARAVKDGRPVDALVYVITFEKWPQTRAALHDRLRSKGIEPIPLLS